MNTVSAIRATAAAVFAGAFVVPLTLSIVAASLESVPPGAWADLCQFIAEAGVALTAVLFVYSLLHESVYG